MLSGALVYKLVIAFVLYSIVDAATIAICLVYVIGPLIAAGALFLVT